MMASTTTLPTLPTCMALVFVAWMVFAWRLAGQTHLHQHPADRLSFFAFLVRGMFYSVEEWLANPFDADQDCHKALNIIVEFETLFNGNIQFETLGAPGLPRNDIFILLWPHPVCAALHRAAFGRPLVDHLCPLTYFRLATPPPPFFFGGLLLNQIRQRVPD